MEPNLLENVANRFKLKMNEGIALLEEVLIKLKLVVSQLSNLPPEIEVDASLSHWLCRDDFRNPIITDNIAAMLEAELSKFEAQNSITRHQLFAETPFYDKNTQPKFRFIDLFAGIGGFNLALTRNKGACVFSCEWDTAAKSTYFKNYGKLPFGDINKFVSENVSDDFIDRCIPNHELLAAGFPCQPFSLAGVSARVSRGIQHGFKCETQGTLFYSIARIAYVKQPAVVLLENVKNILNHDKGKTFTTIRETMENLGDEEHGKQGYQFYFTTVNSQTVVAQRRERIFMVCVRNDIDLGDFNFPVFDGEPIALRTVLDNMSVEEAATYTISDKLWQGHQRRTVNNLARNTGFVAYAANLDRPSNTIVARYGKDGKECLIPQDGSNPRTLSINECGRLFGYPENFITAKAKTVSYKQFGNSVVVPVVEKIGHQIVNHMGWK